MANGGPGGAMSAHSGKFVAYYRVSTDKQGKSGLGLEAQRQAVLQFLDGGSWSLVGEFTEVESGKRNERPELHKALAACKRHKAKLVIAKLDRLSRNLAFIATLMDSGEQTHDSHSGGSGTARTRDDRTTYKGRTASRQVSRRRARQSQARRCA